MFPHFPLTKYSLEYHKPTETIRCPRDLPHHAAWARQLWSSQPLGHGICEALGRWTAIRVPTGAEPPGRRAGQGMATDDWIKSGCDMKSDAVKDLPSGKRVHHELEPLTIEYHGKTHLNKIDGRFQVRKL